MKKIIGITVNTEDTKVIRQAKVVGEILKHSVRGTLSSEMNLCVIGAVGLRQGLKYNGSFKNGVKGAIFTAGVVVAIDATLNIARNLDVIKDA